MWRDPSDQTSNGFNALTGETGGARDQNGHGTSVAGIIGARSENGKGIRGAASLRDGEGSVVRQPAELMSVTVLRQEDSAGSSDVIGRAVLWAMSRHAEQQQQPGRGQQKLIINLSLAGAFDASRYPYLHREDGTPVLHDDAIDFAAENDVLIIAAAGNESCRIGGPCGISGQSFAETWYHPCSYENVLCVVASTHEDKLAGFSNRGASVDLVAPGWGIFSTSKSGNSRYSYFSGTSVATPLVTSAAAIIWSLYPQLKADDVISVLRKSAARIPGIQDQIDSGDGRLDLHAAALYAAALVESGTGPSDMEPPLVTSEARQFRAPPIEGDPDAPSSDAYGAATQEKKSAATGCGSISGRMAGAPDGRMLSLLLILVPLFYRDRLS
jgi:cell wall-associated protease